MGEAGGWGEGGGDRLGEIRGSGRKRWRCNSRRSMPFREGKGVGIFGIQAKRSGNVAFLHPCLAW